MIATATDKMVSDFISLLMVELMVSEVTMLSSIPNFSASISLTASLCSTFRVAVLKITSLESCTV